MAQTVSSILAHTDQLAARAWRITGDVNEAGLLVGIVMSRAFDELGGDEPAEAIARHLAGDLDKLLREREAA